MQSADVLKNIASFDLAIRSNVEYFLAAKRDKASLIEWYKDQKHKEMTNVGLMYDSLISRAEMEMANMDKHIAYLGITLPDEVTPPKGPENG